MMCNYKNGEGYPDPTAGEALRRIEREEKRMLNKAIRAGLVNTNGDTASGFRHERCFAYVEPKDNSVPFGCCMATNSRFCTGTESCPFYKSVSDAKADLRRANRRLRSLPIEKQMEIADKYHEGMMPWRIDDEHE